MCQVLIPCFNSGFWHSRIWVRHITEGSDYYSNTLQCYLQAVAIDGKDVVLWNRLGTLACFLGSFGIARRAFEQGLHCSPNHWGCMEKLIEVLIAIGDETACLAVVKKLLKASPLHPRAELIRRVIEENLDIEGRQENSISLKSKTVTLCGIDKLKPQHSSLHFPEKRKTSGLEDQGRLSKRRNCYNTFIHVQEASWVALISGIANALKEAQDNISNGLERNIFYWSDPCAVASSPCIGNALVSFSFRKINNFDGEMVESESRNATVGKCDRVKDVDAGAGLVEQLPITSSPLPCCQLSYVDRGSEHVEDTFHEGRKNLEGSGGDGISIEGGLTLKERDASTDEEPHYLERRSTRLERIRTRKFDRSEEMENMQSEHTKGSESCKSLRQLLEPFIVCYDQIKKIPMVISESVEADKMQNICSDEEREVLQFVKDHMANSGLQHISQKLLEKISICISKPLSSWKGFVELERLSRCNSQERSAYCSLFLGELYMDLAISAADNIEATDFIRDCEYNLCKAIESIAMKISSFSITWAKESISLGTLDNEQLKDALGEPLAYAEDDHCWSFWVRYYWLSGRLRNFMANCKTGKEDFKRCLSILEAKGQFDRESANILLQHCRHDRRICTETVSRKLYELQIGDMLQHSAAKMLEEGQHADLINVLTPLLFTAETRETGVTSPAIGKKHIVDFSAELAALNMLVTACENSNPKKHIVALQCYGRRLEIFAISAGFLNWEMDGNPLNCLTQDVVFHKSNKTQEGADCLKMVGDEVKSISRCAAYLNELGIDNTSLLDTDGRLIGRIQKLILIVMCYTVTVLAVKRHSTTSSDLNDHLEATCFVDGAVAFCRLQHLCTAVSMEDQVGLLVTMHDILAEHGLCCAGKACEGGEGAFLKMAIKHLLSLEMKLKGGTISLACQNKDRLHTSLEIDISDVPSVEKCRGITESLPSCEELTKMDLPLGSDEQIQDVEKRKVELGLDNALDQSFFCLYGLNLRGGMESACQDGLALHDNTSLGDYQTKEQCAGVFQYLLPYAKVCSRACLLKLRRVLRAIRKQFPEPPASILENNVLDTFLEDLEFDEVRLRGMVLSGKDVRDVFKFVFTAAVHEMTNTEGTESVLAFTPVHTDGAAAADSEDSAIVLVDTNYFTSSPYFEVYANLYYLLTQVEELSASDKWPGFVFTKEGEEFVEQNVNLFKYDLLYNPLRFETWLKLANIYDEEVDLMLNDGSKTHNATVWRKNNILTSRVESGRRHSRRCLLISLALAKTPEQLSQAHELLALVYYDNLQNVVPSYDQRQHVAVRDAAWRMVCQNAFEHFEKAFSYKPEWIYLFYLGKLAEKLGRPGEIGLSYYKKAAEMNPSAVDPIYRIHASRLKLLCASSSTNLDVIQVVATYCYLPISEDRVSSLLEGFRLSRISKCAGKNSTEVLFDEDNGDNISCEKSLSGPVENNLREAWQCLFEDCIKALEVCLEGELKHFHKARFQLAQGLISRNEANDIERAKEELSFCFKSNRSLFTINMWEIDGSTKRNRRRTPGSSSSRRGLELSMPESSRKFITCLRKYLLLYLYLCEKTGDLCTLERAYSSLRVDKKFSLCLADLINVALGKYIYTLGVAICHAEASSSASSKCSLNSLLDKFFNLFMDHASSWSDVAGVSLGEAGLLSAPEVSEGAIYGYIHKYLYSLEVDNRVDVLESVNEKIRKRFKSPKLLNTQCSQVCKQAVLSWCRALCCALSAITPLTLESASEGPSSCIIDQGQKLFVELCSDELMANPYEAYCSHFNIESLSQGNPMLSMRGIFIRQAIGENLEKASLLLRQSFTFYRDCAGPFPAGINLFLQSSGTVVQGVNESMVDLPSTSSLVGIDLSVPRKLLLWAYTLVHGRTCSIAEAVRYCEDQAKMRLKKGQPIVGAALSSLNSSQERNPGSGSKVAICQQSMQAGVLDDKEKAMLDEHESIGGGSSCILPSYNTHLCSPLPGPTKQFCEELAQADDGFCSQPYESCDHDNFTSNEGL